mgnify:FL=1
MPRLSDTDRFEASFDKRGPDECWPWSRSGVRDYGRILFNGQRQLAHRVAYELATGSPPADDVEVCHHCDNPACVNPSHLFLGTHADNMRDAAVKGRMRPNPSRGEASSRAKLRADDVRAIRSIRSAEGLSHAVLARRFGVCEQSIKFILDGKTWRSVQ